MSGQGWQPIETAPRDETSVDLWVEGDNFGWRIPDAWWCPAAKKWLTSDAEYGAPGPCLGLRDRPTHWMPIPAGPTPQVVE